MASVSSSGEIGLAVGRAVQREGFADRRDRTQPVRADHLVDEHEMILLDHGEVDRLLEFVRQLHQERPRYRHEIGARRGGEAQDGRPKPHPAVGRRRDQKFLRRERGHDALHRRARKIHALRDLPETQAVRLVLERMQDRRGPRNHLHLGLVVQTLSANRLHALSRRLLRDLAAWFTV